MIIKKVPDGKLIYRLNHGSLQNRARAQPSMVWALCRRDRRDPRRRQLQLVFYCWGGGSLNFIMALLRAFLLVSELVIFSFSLSLSIFLPLSLSFSVSLFALEMEEAWTYQGSAQSFPIGQWSDLYLSFSLSPFSLSLSLSLYLFLFWWRELVLNQSFSIGQ